MAIILGGIAMFLLGLFMVLFPYKYWMFSERWKNKSGAEPTNRYIIGVRICIRLLCLTPVENRKFVITQL